MKHLIIYLPFLLFACTNETDNVSIISLPYKEAGVNLVDSTVRQIKWRDLTLQIKFETEERFVSEDSPFLFSMDKNGKIIDSLKLFRRQPYYGTDSGYDPWIEISKAGIITSTDTFMYHGPRSKESIKGTSVYVMQDLDTCIIVNKYKINRFGKFSEIK